MDGLIATMPYDEYLKVRDRINEEHRRGLTTSEEWKERRFMLECKYWLGVE
jgi:hypothetical protein